MRKYMVHMNMNGKYIRRHFITRFEQCTDGKWRLKAGVYMIPSHSTEAFASFEEGHQFVLNNRDYIFNFDEPEYSQEFLDYLDALLEQFNEKHKLEYPAGF